MALANSTLAVLLPALFSVGLGLRLEPPPVHQKKVANTSEHIVLMHPRTPHSARLNTPSMSRGIVYAHMVIVVKIFWRI